MTDAESIRTIALALPEVREEITGKATALECAVFKAKDRAFLFLARADLRLKLDGSIAEATALAAREPERFRIGPFGWAQIRFDAATPLARDLIARWIDESYRSAAGLPAPTPTPTAVATVEPRRGPARPRRKVAAKKGNGARRAAAKRPRSAKRKPPAKKPPRP